MLGKEPLPADHDLSVRLVAICGFDTCVGAATSKLKLEPRKPVAIRGLRSA